MSYCRMPSYIYPTGDGVNFNATWVSDHNINIFLYKLFVTRRKEFIERIKDGKETIIDWQDEIIKNSSDDDKIDSEQKYKDWLLDSEDELFKMLMSENPKEE